MQTELDDFGYRIDIIITNFKEQEVWSYQKACRDDEHAKELYQRLREVCDDFN